MVLQEVRVSSIDVEDIKLFTLCNSSFQDKGIEIWARPISPISQGHYSYAIAFLNRRTDGTPSEVKSYNNSF